MFFEFDELREIGEVVYTTDDLYLPNFEPIFAISGEQDHWLLMIVGEDGFLGINVGKALEHELLSHVLNNLDRQDFEVKKWEIASQFLGLSPVDVEFSEKQKDMIDNIINVARNAGVREMNEATAEGNYVTGEVIIPLIDLLTLENPIRVKLTDDDDIPPYILLAVGRRGIHYIEDSQLRSNGAAVFQKSDVRSIDWTQVKDIISIVSQRFVYRITDDSFPMKDNPIIQRTLDAWASWELLPSGERDMLRISEF